MGLQIDRVVFWLRKLFRAPVIGLIMAVVLFTLPAAATWVTVQLASESEDGNDGKDLEREKRSEKDGLRAKRAGALRNRPIQFVLVTPPAAPDVAKAHATFVPPQLHPATLSVRRLI